MQVCEDFFPFEVEKELKGRECFIDAGEGMIADRIFNYDVFDAILGEDSEKKKMGLKPMSQKAIKFMEDFINIVDEGQFDYIMVTSA